MYKEDVQCRAYSEHTLSNVDHAMHRGEGRSQQVPLKMVARHFMLSLCQLTPLNLEEPLPVGALFKALAFTVTVSPAAAVLGTCRGPEPAPPRCAPASGFTACSHQLITGKTRMSNILHNNRSLV